MNWNGIGSLFIACIEIVLLINLLIFGEKNRFNIIAIVMIAVLAGYQSLEFLMCQMGYQNSVFPYLAYIDISFLPPLNLLLVLTLTGSLNNLTRILNRLKYLIFLPVISFTIYYTLVISQFKVTSCAVLYATYHYPSGELFGFFYYLPILLSIILLIIKIKKEDDHKLKLIMKLLLTGAIFISLPVVLGFILMFAGSYQLISAIESIMCKFAVVYAVLIGYSCLINTKKKEWKK
jgi:hypothetical protein